MTATNNKNKTLKKALNLNENKNTKQVITKSENIEICPQKSPQNACLDQKSEKEMAKTYKIAENSGAEVVVLDTKDIVEDKILVLRNRYASRTVISAEEFKSALAEIENAIK